MRVNEEIDLPVTADDETILCSDCFGALGCRQIIALLPGVTCDHCGKTCLGFVVPAKERTE